MKRIFLFSTLLFFAQKIFSQSWQEMMANPGNNFYDIQKTFNEYWKDKDVTVKGRGYKPFRRWEYFVEQRVYPSGDLSQLNNTWKNFKEFQNSYSSNLRNGGGNGGQINSSTWIAIGPMGAPTGSANNGFPRKAGRDNFVTFHPTNQSTFWSGSPAGGLWNTTNNGTNWTTTTDYLSVIGCSDLAIDPANPSIMYLATGDGDGGDTYSIGVLKSTDGGQTWNTTGLTYAVSVQRQIRRLIINPVNTQILIAATSAGIFYTNNGGTTWTQSSSGNFYDVEFNTGNPNTVYAAGTAFYLSTNGGTSFSLISSGISTGAQRMNIAVTSADPTYVYVLASSNTSSGLLGVYQSTNSGTSFVTKSTTPDILSNPCSSPSGGGQGWYDLAFAASPLNKNEIVVGGVNVWRSTDGGTSFSIIGCWIGTGNPPYVHADEHELEYNSTGVLYSCNDGGIFRYNGITWTDITASRNIAEIYKIGLSALSPSMWITGHQDNGTNIFNNGIYSASMAGDGMDCFIDRTNNSNMFASYYQGNFQRSTNGGSTWSAATSGITGTGGWVSPWKQDPQNSNLLYAGTTQMFVSNNLGANWTALSNTGGSGTIVEFAIAPSNNQVIYVIHGTSIRKTTNAGSSWTNVTGTIPAGSAAPTFITISPTDPNKVWVTCSGYSAGNKVFMTTNGGTSWTNVSSNLPNIPANCSVYQVGSNDLVYVGMDVGVYYKDISTTNWTLYNTGLPNVPVHDMEISPASPTKIRAATYGRGVYETDVYQATTAPTSSFGFSGSSCVNQAIKFLDMSINGPSTWTWNVSPSAGVTINSPSAQNPTITFPSSGTYTVSLITGNSFGTSLLFTKTITVNTNPTLLFAGSTTMVCVGDSAKLFVSGANSYTWNPGFFPGNSLLFIAGFSQTYTVTGANASGCSSTDSIQFKVALCEGIAKNIYSLNEFKVYPNPANSKITIVNKSNKYQNAELEIQDLSGKIILTQSLSFKKDKNELIINVASLASGFYNLTLRTPDSKKQLVKILKE